MTTLLQTAFTKTQLLPEEEQNSIAAQILAELEDEQQWSKQFYSTTSEQWERIAENVRKDLRHGETIPINEIFPSDAAR